MIAPLPLAVAAMLPLVFGSAAWFYLRRRRRVATALGDNSLVARIAGADFVAAPWTRLALVGLAVLLLAAAAIDPRWGFEPAAAQAGIDLVLVQDASNSMLVEDVGTSRLELQRRLSREILARRGGDRIGVVVFAGRAYILSPPTQDHGAVALYLEAVGPDIVEQTGSSLAAAIRQGTALLAGVADGQGARVMLVSADGEVHGERDEVLAAARRAGEVGLIVHTAGIGSTAGGPVPDLDAETGERRGYKVDPETGQVAISRADTELLREVARLGGGRYFDLAAPGSLDQLQAALATQRRTLGGGEPQRDHAPRYRWFVSLAVVLLVAEMFAARRPRREREER